MAKTDKGVFYGTGRRKSSIARVRLIEGKGKITINGKDINWEEVYQNIVNIATNYKYSDQNDSKKYIKK